VLQPQAFKFINFIHSTNLKPLHKIGVDTVDMKECMLHTIKNLLKGQGSHFICKSSLRDVYLVNETSITGCNMHQEGGSGDLMYSNIVVTLIE